MELKNESFCIGRANHLALVFVEGKNISLCDRGRLTFGSASPGAAHGSKLVNAL